MSLQDNISDVVTLIGNDIKNIQAAAGLLVDSTVEVRKSPHAGRAPELCLIETEDPVAPEVVYDFDDQVLQAWSFRDGLKGRVGNGISAPLTTEYNRDRYGNKQEYLTSDGLYASSPMTLYLKNTRFLNGGANSAPTNWSLVHNTGRMTYPDIGVIEFTTYNSNQVIQQTIPASANYYYAFSMDIEFDGTTSLGNTVGFSYTTSGALSNSATFMDGVKQDDLSVLPTKGVHQINVYAGVTVTGTITILFGAGVLSSTTSTIIVSNCTAVDNLGNIQVVLTGENEKFDTETWSFSYTLTDAAFINSNLAYSSELFPNPYLDGPYTNGVPNGVTRLNSPICKEISSIYEGHTSAINMICGHNASASGFYIPNSVYAPGVTTTSFLNYVCTVTYKVNTVSLFENIFPQRQLRVFRTSSTNPGSSMGADGGPYSAKYYKPRLGQVLEVSGTTDAPATNTFAFFATNYGQFNVDIYKISIRKLLGYIGVVSVRVKMCNSSQTLAHINGSQIEILSLFTLTYNYNAAYPTHGCLYPALMYIEWEQNDIITLFMRSNAQGSHKQYGYTVHDKNNVQKTSGIIWGEFLEFKYLYTLVWDSLVGFAYNPLYLQSIFISKKYDYPDTELLSIMDGLS